MQNLSCLEPLIRIQEQKFSQRALLLLIAVAVMLGATAKALFADNIGEGTTTTGQTLLIQIDDPNDAPGGVRVYRENEEVTITGQVAISNLFTTTHVVYVVDVSSSTTVHGPSGLDCNGDGINGNDADNLNQDSRNGSVLDCEISGVMALNQNLIASQRISTGLVLFGGRAVVAALHPTQTGQIFTQGDADINHNGMVDIEEVALTLRTRGVDQFVSQEVGVGTDFNAAITRLEQVYNSVLPSSQKTAFFLSDGRHNQGGFAREMVEQIAQAGIVVNTYAVGTGTAGCDIGTDLQFIADQTAGICTLVEDPTQLRTALTSTTPSLINHIEVRIENNSPITITTSATGHWALDTTICRTPGQSISVVEATVVANDGTRVGADIGYPCDHPTAIEPAKEPIAPTNTHMLFLPLVVAEE